MFKRGILFSLMVSLLFLSACSLKKTNEISLEEAKTKSEDFINQNFTDPSFPVTVSSVEVDEVLDLYKLEIDFGNGNEVEAYLSKDGKKFFPEAYEIEEIEKITAEMNNNNQSDSAESIEPVDFNSDKKVVVYFFYGEGCPHCSKQKEAMKAWSESFPDMEIKSFETWSNAQNGEILQNLAKAYGTSVQGVPMTFIGDEFWVGYSDSLGTEMQGKIKDCSKAICENPGQRLK